MLGQEQLRPVDRAGRQEREQADDRAAAEGEGDTGPHHTPAECRRPAASVVAGGHDPGDLVASLDAADVTGHEAVHRLVDLDQVLVVDRAPGHSANLDGADLVDGGLVVECQVDEGDVRGHVAQPAGLGDRQHGGRHIRRPGSGRQEHLADPQRQVEGFVDLASLSHVPCPITTSRVTPLVLGARRTTDDLRRTSSKAQTHASSSGRVMLDSGDGPQPWAKVADSAMPVKSSTVSSVASSAGVHAEDHALTVHVEHPVPVHELGISARLALGLPEDQLPVTAPAGVEAGRHGQLEVQPVMTVQRHRHGRRRGRSPSGRRVPSRSPPPRDRPSAGYRRACTGRGTRRRPAGG